MRAFSRTSAMSSSRIRPATRGVYAAPPTPYGGLWKRPRAGGTPQGGPAPGPRRQDGLMTFSDPVDTPVSGPGPVPVRSGEPTLGALVHDLSQQLPDLIRSELRLAQAEVTEKGRRAGLGVGMFSAAGLLAFFALGTLVATGVIALSEAVPAWAAGLIVAAALLVAAAVAALMGRQKVSEATPAKPE